MRRKIQTTFEIPELPGTHFPWYGRMDINKWRVMRQYVWKRDSATCQYCGIKLELYECEVHHVLDLNQGGTNHPSNLKTTCIPDHVKKHPWIQRIRGSGPERMGSDRSAQESNGMDGTG